MQTLEKLHLLHLLLLTINFFSTTCIAQQTPMCFCGKIRINQTPSMIQNSTESSSLLNRMILCKSQKLYFRTSLGLFPISSIDYTSKTLTIPHPPSCSSSLHFISPSLLSAGFVSPPQRNSLLLFNCSNQRYSMTAFMRNCTTRSHSCGASSLVEEQALKGTYSCLLADDVVKLDIGDDVVKLDIGFHPTDLNCSHYSRVFRRSLIDADEENYELGTRISFDIPGHVPDVCNECEKPNGNCGVGLRCVCHPKECRDKVISASLSTKLTGNILLSLLSFIVLVMGFLIQET